MLFHNKSEVSKALLIQGEHYNLVERGMGTTVADVENMGVPNIIILPTTLSMDQGARLPGDLRLNGPPAHHHGQYGDLWE